MLDVKQAPQAKKEVVKGQEKPAEVGQRGIFGWPFEGHPFAFMRRFSREMDRMLEELGMNVPSVVGREREAMIRPFFPGGGEWAPKVEVFEKDEHLFVRAELPGLTKDDVHVEVTDEALVIRGEKKQEKREKREGFAYSECSYGSFYRAIPLPEGIDPSKAEAEFHNGVLEIRMPLPLKPAPAPHKLVIQEKKQA
jgi:HSP20 family protein